MSGRKIGLIRVLTTDNRELLDLHGRLIMEFFPGLDVRSECIPDQPEGVHDDETEALAIPKVVALAEQMERDGAEAVIVSCAGDPGVLASKGRVGVPVIGAGRAAAHMACLLNRPVGVLGITEAVPPAIAGILGGLMVADRVPDGVVSTLDLMKPEGMRATVDAGRDMLRRGAECLVLACTGMSTIGAAAVLRRELGVPVIDPVRAEAAAAWVALG